MRRIIVFFLLILISGILFGDSEIKLLEDKLNNAPYQEKLEIYQELSKLYSKTDLDKAIEYLEKRLNLAISLDKNEKVPRIYLNLGILFHKKGELEKSINLLKKAEEKSVRGHLQLEILETLGELYNENRKYSESIIVYKELLELIKHNRSYMHLKSKIYRDLADNYLSINLYEKSLSFAYDALEINKLEDVKDDLLKDYKLIGEIFLKSGEWKKALENFQQYLKLAKSEGKVKEAGKANFSIANVYNSKNELEKALEFYRESSKLFIINQNEVELAKTYYFMAKNFIDLKKYYEAQFYAGNSYRKSQKFVLDDLQLKNTILLLNISIIMDEKKSAENYVHKLKNELPKIKSITLKMELYKSLKSYFKYMEDYEKALLYSEKYNKLTGSFWNSQRLQKFTQLEVLYDVNKERKENEILSLQIDYEKKFNIFVGGLFLVTLLILIFLIRSRNISKRSLQKIKDQNHTINSQRRKLKETIVALKKTSENNKKNMEEIIKLEKKNTALAMAVTASHELNQPLTVLRGNIEMFEAFSDESKFDVKQVKYLKKIKDSLDRIEEISHKYRTTRDFKVGRYSENTEMLFFEENENE